MQTFAWESEESHVIPGSAELAVTGRLDCLTSQYYFGCHISVFRRGVVEA
jgi:hypothetical protein